MSARTLLVVYRLVLATLLTISSVMTLASTEHEATVLAGVEIAGALAFTWRRTQYLGAAALLGVFTVAEGLSISHGRLPTHLLQYAAAVMFVVAMERRLLDCNDRV